MSTHRQEPKVARDFTQGAGPVRREARSPRTAAWREAGLLGAVIAAAFLPFDLLYPHHLGATLLLRLALCATLLLAWRRLGRRTLAARAAAAELERRETLAQLEDSERRRAASERLALVGRLASGIGHEINNPLSAVKGNVSCALEELERLDAAPGAREALSEALAATERIAWITADLRAFSTVEDATLVPCAARDTICDALNRAADRLGGTRVLVSVEAGLPPIRSEPRLLADAIAQLVAQAATAGGPARRDEPPTIRICARRAAAGVEISIEDEGPRIPAHVLPMVFEPFAAQGEMKGAVLGLTLPMTRQLAERSGCCRVDAAWHEHGNRYTLTLATAAE